MVNQISPFKANLSNCFLRFTISVENRLVYSTKGPKTNITAFQWYDYLMNTNLLITFDSSSFKDHRALVVVLCLVFQLLFVALISCYHLILLDFLFSWWDLCFEESFYSERPTLGASTAGDPSVLSIQPSKFTSTSWKCHYCSQGKLDTNRYDARIQIMILVLYLSSSSSVTFT